MKSLQNCTEQELMECWLVLMKINGDKMRISYLETHRQMFLEWRRKMTIYCKSQGDDTIPFALMQERLDEEDAMIKAGSIEQEIIDDEDHEDKEACIGIHESAKAKSSDVDEIMQFLKDMELRLSEKLVEPKVAAGGLFDMTKLVVYNDRYISCSDLKSRKLRKRVGGRENAIWVYDVSGLLNSK